MNIDPIHARLVPRSIEVIRDGQAATGAYLASPTFPTYQYSWFRDGAFIADAMSRVGEVRSAEAFFGWCAKILTDRRDQVLNLVARGERGVEDVALTDHLHTRYAADGTESPVEWENFQLDGYGTWLWALGEHRTRHDVDVAPFAAGIELTVLYLCTFWSSPFYDWWEENGDLRHPSSLAAVRAGLVAASSWPELPQPLRDRAEAVADEIRRFVLREAVVGGHLVKHVGSIEVDASLVACVTPFRLVEPEHPIALSTIERVRRELAPEGVYRYLADTFYGGGEWVLLAAFLGWHDAEQGDREAALARLEWIGRQADADLHLPEQVDSNARFPDRIDEWVQRWGPSARPLLWSHAMYLTLAHALGLTTQRNP